MGAVAPEGLDLQLQMFDRLREWRGEPVAPAKRRKIHAIADGIAGDAPTTSGLTRMTSQMGAPSAAPSGGAASSMAPPPPLTFAWAPPQPPDFAAVGAEAGGPPAAGDADARAECDEEESGDEGGEGDESTGAKAEEQTT